MEKIFSSKWCVPNEFFILNSYKFSHHKFLKSGNATKKNFKIFLKLDKDEIVISEPNSHDHNSDELAQLE